MNINNLTADKFAELQKQLENGHPNQKNNHDDSPTMSEDDDPIETTNTSAFKSFHYLEDNTVSYSILDTIETRKQLLPGSYTLKYMDGDPGYVKISINKNEEKIKLYNFEHKEKIDKFINSFFDKNVSKYIKSFGFLHKAGILLSGKEGGGKTSMIRHYSNNLIKSHNAIVFYISSTYGFTMVWEFLQNIRKIHKNPIIIVIDEIDEYVHNYEAFLKNALDGNNSIDYSLVFATTNYIHKIPDALKSRPSRFKYSLTIGGLENHDDIEDIMQKILIQKFSKREIKAFAAGLVGETLDSIKQFCLDKIMDLDIEKINNKTIGFKK